MVDTRASSCLENAKDDTVDQLSVPTAGPSNLPATAQVERNQLAIDEATRNQLAVKEATLAIHLADLQQSERVDLLRQSIAEMEARKAARSLGSRSEPQQVAGNAPAPPIELTASTSLASNRRPRDESDDMESAGQSPPSHKRQQYDINLHIPFTTRYAGRSYREYTAYIRSCEQCFEARPHEFYTDRARALFVKAWSKGNAQDAIYRRLSSV